MHQQGESSLERRRAEIIFVCANRITIHIQQEKLRLSHHHHRHQIWTVITTSKKLILMYLKSVVSHSPSLNQAAIMIDLDGSKSQERDDKPKKASKKSAHTLNVESAGIECQELK